MFKAITAKSRSFIIKSQMIEGSPEYLLIPTEGAMKVSGMTATLTMRNVEFKQYYDQLIYVAYVLYKNTVGKVVKRTNSRDDSKKETSYVLTLENLNEEEASWFK